MDLSRTRIVLRERAAVDILDLAVRFVVVHARVYARTSLALIPFVVGSVLVSRTLGWPVAWGVSIFTATFAAAPFTLLASRLVFEDEVVARVAVKDALLAAPRLFLLRLVTFFAGALGLVVLIHPGIWVLSVTFFVVEIAALERAKPGAALARSLQMFRRESGEVVLGLFLLAALHVAAVLSADIGGRAFVSALLESRAPEPIWAEGGSVLGLIGFWLFVPYAATARFFVYLDVRTRSEGWDIQTRFVALAARTTEPVEAHGAVA
jgi:hypothetical protein